MSKSSDDDAGSNPLEDLGIMKRNLISTEIFLATIKAIEYEGDRNETGERHGIGRAQLPNNDLYEGEYKYGKRDGEGVYYFIRNRAKYTGSYKEGVKHGHGTMIYPDGSKYIGSWDHNRRQGYGTYHYVNGDTYEGEWLNDLKHGQGTYRHHQSQVEFKGMWNLGKEGGMADVYYPNFRYQGYFHDGLPIGKGTFFFNHGYHQKGIYMLDVKEEIVNDERLTYKTQKWITDGKIIELTEN